MEVLYVEESECLDLRYDQEATVRQDANARGKTSKRMGCLELLWVGMIGREVKKGEECERKSCLSTGGTGSGTSVQGFGGTTSGKGSLATNHRASLLPPLQPFGLVVPTTRRATVLFTVCHP